MWDEEAPAVDTVDELHHADHRSRLPLYYRHQHRRPMTQTFADYVATQDARNTIELNVRKWTLMLCEALQENFIEDSIKRQQFFG